MATYPEFELKIIESRENILPPEPDDEIPGPDQIPSVDEMIARIKATKGAAAVLDRMPKFLDFPLPVPRHEIARFSGCTMSGTATSIEFWDAHRYVCGASPVFAADGTPTGRIDCYFRVPSNGDYKCWALLNSHPSTESAGVECFIDDESFGPLEVLGFVLQPHPTRLSEGSHRFRIQHLSGTLVFGLLIVESVL
jgi:hypothetical protein